MWPMENISIRPPVISILHFKIVAITNSIFYNFGISSGSLPGAILPPFVTLTVCPILALFLVI